MRSPPTTPRSSSEAKPSAPGSSGTESEQGPRVFSVSELNQGVKRLLENTIGPIWVGGEIANFSRPRSGHCYFTLKDDQAQVRCVMWRGVAEGLPMLPEDGTEVRVRAQVTLYEGRGEYQLGVKGLEATGEGGLWKLAFEKLKKRLDTEGLLAPERKRRPPRFPHRIGVVTSETAAAFQDILNVLRRRAPWVDVVLSPCRVQGDGASEEIARAIGRFQGQGPEVDVLIVARGGGSIEDLWAFNTEVVARSIASSLVPVISAVGHETDITIADLVADLRAPTPSAGAECAVPDRAAMEEYLLSVPERMIASLLRPIEERGRVVERLWERMQRAWTYSHRNAENTLGRLAAQIQALSPLGAFERGYAVPQDGSGRLLRSLEDFESGEPFLVRLMDGRVHATTHHTEHDPLPRPDQDAGDTSDE